MKLATVERIKSLTPIENADMIVLARVLGWDCVVKKAEFSVGDFCVYIPIDTMVDPSRPCFSFLLKNKVSSHFIRIKTTKLKGKWSEGLVLPISCLDKNKTYNEGDDVSEELGVIKYETENPILTSGVTTRFSDFPTNYISKTDEDNLRTKYNVLDEMIGKELYITQKMDGSSMTIIWHQSKDGFLVCSRRFILEEGSVMYQYVLRENIKENLIRYGKNLAIQGEFCGPKINCNQLGLSDYKFFVFTIKNLDTNEYYDWTKIKNTCFDLNLKPVPFVSSFICDSSYTINKFQEIANEQTYTHPNNKKVPGEGIVIRTVTPFFSSELGKNLSVKVINQNYKV